MVALVLGLLVLLLVVGTVVPLFGPVDRARVRRFAVRQGLTVTADNGNSVIRYLATTRRWRGGLLWLALLGFVLGAVATRHGVTLSVFDAFCGWFAGAVVAEWRVDALTRGPRAAALLRARRLTDYVGPRVVCFVVLVWSAVAVLGVTAVVVSLGRSTGRTGAVVTLLACVLVATIICAVVRRVLERPQPLVAVDLLDADQAIRGRSLHVLLGSALAIGGYLIAVTIGQVVARDDDVWIGVAIVIGDIALPVLGVVVARGPRRMSRRVLALEAAG